MFDKIKKAVLGKKEPEKKAKTKPKKSEIWTAG